MGRLAHNHCAAFLGGVCAVAGSTAQVPSLEAQVATAVAEFEQLAGATVRDTLQRGADQLIGAGLEKVQRTLAQPLRRTATRRLRAELSSVQRNWVMGASTEKSEEAAPSPGASDWLYAVPTAPALTMFNRSWRTALALRLMVSFVPSGTRCMGVSCSSPTPCNAVLDVHGWHAFGCARGHVTCRHNALRDLWRDAARHAGCRASVEQVATELGTSARADVRVESDAAPWPLFWECHCLQYSASAPRAMTRQ